MSNKPKIQKGQFKEKQPNNKPTRGKRYSQYETDLLCDLVLASDINTMVTNQCAQCVEMLQNRIANLWQNFGHCCLRNPNIIGRGLLEITNGHHTHHSQ